MAQTPLRPRNLPAMDAADINAMQENTSGVAYEWVIPVDSTQTGGNDNGTLSVPMGRIAMRDTNGLIPASMLPSYVDDIKFGTLSVGDSGVTFTTFDERDPHVEIVYSSPEQTGGQVEPPNNTIFYDRGTNVQYRYIETTNPKTRDNLWGFIAIPNSKTLSEGYGIELTIGSTTTEIAAKTPDYNIGHSTSSVSLNSTDKGFGTYSSDSYDDITVESESNAVTVSGLRQGSLYHVDVDLACYPSTKTADIVTLSLKQASTVVCKTNYDMSSNASNGSEDAVAFYLDFRSSGTSTTFSLSGESNNTVTAKVSRFSIVELV